MAFLDWLALGFYFVLIVGIGLWAYRRVKGSADFFVGGGKVPWWLAGVSHHATGYSATVFVAYAAIAYTHGFTIYMWWALTIGIGLIAGAFLIAPRWVRLRIHLGVETPTTYLAQRYNVTTQQIVAWSGVLLKLFELGAKWAAIGILLNAFAGVSIAVGILLAGGVTLVYIVVGGLWADLWTDLAQFVIQMLAATIMTVTIIRSLDGVDSIFGIWDQLPAENGQLFNEPYTAWYALAFLLVNFLSYNGGTWSLAARYMSTPSEKSARNSALLSGGLMLVVPFILFFPMWASPLIMPGLEDPSNVYALLAQQYLPAGIIGLTLAGLFSATMSSTSSDINTVSGVITRDILPRIVGKFRGLNQRSGLVAGRVTTFLFAAGTLIIGIQSEAFGGVIGLTIQWFGALVGPVSVPLIFGLIPAFRHSGPAAANGAIIGGIATFTTIQFLTVPLALQIAGPVSVAIIVYTVIGLISKSRGLSADTERVVRAVQGIPEQETVSGRAD